MIQLHQLLHFRPHLETFLKKVTSLYELHIYTMGTRNYAAAVANVIDPDGKYFSQRILSRDENSSTSMLIFTAHVGSMIDKSIEEQTITCHDNWIRHDPEDDRATLPL
jgi:hypothetical protein